MQYDVGIVIPVYNGLRGVPESTWLRQSIKSALDSDHSSFEVVVVDDGSTDNSLEIAQEYVNDRMRVLAYLRNMGVATALNIGIRATDAKYIMPQGSDDIVTPDKARIMASYLDAHPECLMLGSYYWTCKEDDTVVDERCDLETDPEKIYYEVIAGNLCIGFPMYRKALWEELGGYDVVNFPRRCEDMDFALKVCEQHPGSIHVFPRLMTGYRDTPEALTKAKYFPDYYRALDNSRERRKNTCKPNWGTSPKVLQS